MASTKRKPLSGSPQARWTAKMHKRGRCTVCGNKLQHYKWRCDEHQLQFNAYMKEWRAKRKATAQAPAEAPAEAPVLTSDSQVKEEPIECIQSQNS